MEIREVIKLEDKNVFFIFDPIKKYLCYQMPQNMLFDLFYI